MPTYEQAKRAYTETNEAEKLYAIKNVRKARYILEFKNKTYRETERRFIINGHNDKSDAFRHCYWSALISRKIGFQEAMNFTSIHEVRPGNPFAEKKMDMHNNIVGAKIGQLELNESALSDQCYQALKSGKLKYLVP